MPVLNTKLQGYKSAVYITPDGGAKQKILNLAECDVDVKYAEIDATDHDTDGWEDELPGLGKWTATASIMYVTNSASRQSIQSAILSGQTLAFDFRPTDVVGEENWTGNGVILSFKPLGNAGKDGAQKCDMTISGRGALTPGVIAA
jgi:hypothetical protein